MLYQFQNWTLIDLAASTAFLLEGFLLAQSYLELSHHAMGQSKWSPRKAHTEKNQVPQVTAPTELPVKHQLIPDAQASRTFQLQLSSWSMLQMIIVTHCPN